MDLSIIAILKFCFISILICIPFLVLWAVMNTVHRQLREDSKKAPSSLPPQVKARDVSPEKEWPSIGEEWAIKRRSEAELLKAAEQKAAQKYYSDEAASHEITPEVSIQKPAPNLSKLWASMDKAAAKERAAKRKAKATQKPRPRKKITEEPEGSSAPPQKVITNSTGFERSMDVKSWVLETAIGTCENCDQPAPFMTKGQDYLEVHHVLPLGNGGSDTIQNAVAICPNCHRAFHHSDDREAMKDRLYKRVKRLVRE